MREDMGRMRADMKEEMREDMGRMIADIWHSRRLMKI